MNAMMDHLLRNAKKDQRWRLILAVDTTFGGEMQLMGLVQGESGRFEVVWRHSSFEATYQRNEECRERGEVPPSEPLVAAVHREVARDEAERLLESLSAVHVPLGRHSEHAMDDGVVQTIYVNTRIGHAELEWNIFVPEGWEDVQKWFGLTWDCMRDMLRLPPGHRAWTIGRASGEGGRGTGGFSIGG